MIVAAFGLVMLVLITLFVFDVMLNKFVLVEIKTGLLEGNAAIFLISLAIQTDANLIQDAILVLSHFNADDA